METPAFFNLTQPRTWRMDILSIGMAILSLAKPEELNLKQLEEAQPPADLRWIQHSDNTKIIPLYGRSPKGKRLIAHAPFGGWKTTTFTAGLRCDGLVAPCILDGPMDEATF